MLQLDYLIETKGFKMNFEDYKEVKAKQINRLIQRNIAHLNSISALDPRKKEKYELNKQRADKLEYLVKNFDAVVNSMYEKGLK